MAGTVALFRHMLAADAAHHRQPVLSWHPDIGDDQRRRLDVNLRQRRPRAVDCRDARTELREDGRHQLARRLVVVHQQNEPAGQVDGRHHVVCRRRGIVYPAPDVGASGDRQPYFEHRALAGALAGRRHGAAVQLDQVLDDRQAEAEAAVRRAWSSGRPGGTDRRRTAGTPARSRSPVSRHGDLDVPSRPRRRRTSTRPPAGVNFTAFDSRFQTTCCSRSASPRRPRRSSVDRRAQI